MEPFLRGFSSSRCLTKPTSTAKGLVEHWWGNGGPLESSRYSEHLWALHLSRKLATSVSSPGLPAPIFSDFIMFMWFWVFFHTISYGFLSDFHGFPLRFMEVFQLLRSQRLPERRRHGQLLDLHPAQRKGSRVISKNETWKTNQTHKANETRRYKKIKEDTRRYKKTHLKICWMTHTESFWKVAEARTDCCRTLVACDICAETGDSMWFPGCHLNFP